MNKKNLSTHSLRRSSGQAVHSGQNRRILVFGTFDGLHEGHKNFFKQAKEFGDYLVVVVGRDSTVLKTKKHVPKYNEQERLKKVKLNEFTDEAMLGTENHDPRYDSYDIIKETNPAIICLGYDQAKYENKLKNELKRMELTNIKINILKAYKPEIYHSSLLN